MSDLPRGYLRCTRCTSSFPGKTEDGKDVVHCPGCGLATDQIRPRTARMAMNLLGAAGGMLGKKNRLGTGEIVALALVLLGVGAAAGIYFFRR